MPETTPRSTDRTAWTETHDHRLVAVMERLHERGGTDRIAAAPAWPATDYWRCDRCGQERSRPAGFTDPCPGQPRPHPLHDGGYSVDDPRTRRALSEDMTVRFETRGSEYLVDAESGRTYVVDVTAWTCTCPDFQQRGPDLPGGCKHLRRVDLEVMVGTTPQPDGTFRR